MISLLVARAFAVDPQEPGQQQSEPKTTADYLGDLASDDAPRRLYAARVLRGQLATTLHTVEHGRPGGMAYDEARAALVELAARIPEACMQAVAHPNAVAPCADMLAWLEARESLPLLRTAAARETRKPVKKRIDAAIAAIEALPPAP